MIDKNNPKTIELTMTDGSKKQLTDVSFYYGVYSELKEGTKTPEQVREAVKMFKEKQIYEICECFEQALYDFENNIPM